MRAVTIEEANEMSRPSAERRVKAIEIIDKLIQLTSEEKIIWFPGTPMGYFESRKVVSTGNKPYEERSTEEKTYGGNELTVIWSVPTNFAGMEDQISYWAEVKQEPKEFHLWVTGYRGLLDYGLGMKLMEVADNNMKLQQERRLNG
jgi:hypothetical protein